MGDNRLRTLGAVALFLLASAVYIWGLCPTISWRDSPEFVTIAHTLDIGHPSGSPTYSLLAKLVTFIPIGNIAQRVNFFSAMAGALTVTLVFSLLYEMLTPSPPWVRWSSATSASLFLLVSESFWRFSEVAEVYIPQSCFLITLIFLLLKARIRLWPDRVRYYWLFAFLYGLSAGIHATMALFVPAFLVFIALTERRMFRAKELAFLAFFFLLGFSVYLYLPIRSLADPAFDWGDPQTWQQFLQHILDHKDATIIYQASSWHRLLYLTRQYASYLSQEFLTFGFALGLLGFLYVFLKDKQLWFLLGLTFMSHILFFIHLGWDAAWGYIPSYLIFSIWIGFGVHICFSLTIQIYQRYRFCVLSALIYVSLYSTIAITVSNSFISHLPKASHRKDYSAEVYGKQLLEQLPPNAILFSEYSWFPLLYLQQVESQRPDLTFILQGEVFFPQYFPPASKRRFPNIRLVSSERPVLISTPTYLWNLALLNEKEHPLFWDPDGQNQSIIKANLLPQGLLFSFHPRNKVNISSEILSSHRATLSDSVDHILQAGSNHEASSLLANKLASIGYLFQETGLISEAIQTYDFALEIHPNAKNIHNNYGALLMNSGYPDKALDHFMSAYNQDPIDPVINKNMGNLMLRARAYDQAIEFLNRARNLGVAQSDVYSQLGIAYTELGNKSLALQNLHIALQFLNEPRHNKTNKRNLQEEMQLVDEYIKRAHAIR